MPFTTNWGRGNNVGVRPVNKGMFRDRPSNTIEGGGFWTLKNFRTARDNNGVYRRGGLGPIIENSGISEPIVDIFTIEAEGTKETLVLTEERLFTFGPDGLEEKSIPVNYSGVTWSIDANGRINAIVDSATLALLRAGLPVSQGSTEVGTILTFSGTTVIISNPDGYTSTIGWGDFNTFDRWLGYKGWHASHTYIPGNYEEIIITSYDGVLYRYSPASGLARFTLTDNTGGETAPAPITRAKVIYHFDNLLFFGNVTESDGYKRTRRIFWSELGLYDKVQPQSYVDLPESEGELISIKQLGSILVVYFTDSIYLGRKTNLIDLPYAFEKFDASDLGLQSNRGVISWLDGHFVVMNDDIYYLSNSLALQSIGSPIKDLTVIPCSDQRLMAYVQVAPDIKNSDILFFFPEALESANNLGGSSQKIYRFHYPTAAWSYEEVALNTLDEPLFLYSGVFSSYFYTVDKTWYDWIGDGGYDPSDYGISGIPTDGEVTWDGGTNPAKVSWSDFRYWFDLSQETEVNKTGYYSITQGITQGLYFETLNGYDEVGGVQYPVVEVLETGDLDLNYPDTDKTATRTSVKLKDYTDGPVTLGFYTSNNRGRSFRSQGNLRIRVDEDEGRVDYLSTGSNFRFKIQGDRDSSREPYELMEYVLRVVIRGLQIDDI